MCHNNETEYLYYKKPYHFSQPQSEPDSIEEIILEFEDIKNSTS